ncbi:MAG: hypothetical protein Q3962_02170 [Corynebacterium sp.]|nr:hypothetical protein [Corynebacterium sp.]
MSELPPNPDIPVEVQQVMHSFLEWNQGCQKLIISKTKDATPESTDMLEARLSYYFQNFMLLEPTSFTTNIHTVLDRMLRSPAQMEVHYLVPKDLLNSVERIILGQGGCLMPDCESTWVCRPIVNNGVTKGGWEVHMAIDVRYPEAPIPVLLCPTCFNKHHSFLPFILDLTYARMHTSEGWVVCGGELTGFVKVWLNSTSQDPNRAPVDRESLANMVDDFTSDADLAGLL